RSRQVVVGPRRQQVSAAHRAVLLQPRRPGGDRPARRLDRAGAAGRPRRAHRGPRAVRRDAARERPGRGGGDRALDRTPDRQPRGHEDRVRRHQPADRRAETDRRRGAGLADVPPMKTLDARTLGIEGIARAVDRPPSTVAPDVVRAVESIVADVRARGDAALVDYTARFDGFRASSAAGLALGAAEFEAGERMVEPAVRDALAYAAERIERYHAAALPKSWRLTDEHGSVLGQDVHPLDRVGIYIPGGRAAYPSTVLMTAVPARVAGVREIVLVTPPAADGRVPPAVLAAARVAGVTEGWRLGGAQAVAALAYGTATVRRVDKIVGPGNVYVALAKTRVFGDVGIDMVAGPSEVVVIADRTADPAWIAADLLAQAERDPMARALLITDAPDLLPRVE